MADENKDKKKNSSPTIDLTPKSMASKSVGTLVSIINKHPIDGKYIVKSTNGEFFLLPTERLNYSFVEQEVKIEANDERPYGFDSEIAELNVPKKAAQEALYRNGHVSKDLSDDQIIYALSIRSVFTIVKDKNI